MGLTALLPVGALAGVGSALADKLAKLGIRRIFDLLMHLPKDYEDKGRVVPIGSVMHGQVCLVKAQVVACQNKQGLVVHLHDGTGELVLKFFHPYPALTQAMCVGQTLYVFGEVRVSRFGVQMHHPEWRPLHRPFETGLLPIYSSVKGLHQNKLRQLIRLALVSTDTLFCLDKAHLPQTMADTNLLEVLTQIHLPDVCADVFAQTQLLQDLKDKTHPACRRLVLEELSAHQIVFASRRHNLHQHKAPMCAKQSPSAKRLLAALPFALTNAQMRVVDECVADMATSQPMLRLVQGDVGAGKTLVAALCACHALDAGWQVALMAPTEILASQHYDSFVKWFEPLGVSVGLLLGKQRPKERKQMLADIAQNEAQIVVGTHALFSEGVVFAKLGLSIIDEQHRFGVAQRLALAQKGAMHTTPHQLAMTATPIPRTLAMSVYGDMEVSVIDELPKGRLPITTVTVSRKRRDEVLERIEVNCKQGRQAYWICPLVEEGTSDAQSAQAMYEELCQSLSVSVGLVHGKMKPVEKEAVMASFKAGKLDLLVATTVVEVGVDVPNASLMVIENAERLGLSQLHQLRGRVGRGVEQSFCVLLYQEPLSQAGVVRLNTLRSSTDGFFIAEQDLRLRGAGELLGVRQAGEMGYYIADVVRDEALLEMARTIAKNLLAQDKHLAEKLVALWLGDVQDYVNA